MEKRTFQHSEQLQKLPVPDLRATCERYLKSLEPLQTPEDHAATERAVAQFLESDGPALQEQLLQYDKNHASYVEEFWDDGYLMGNESVVLNLNPFFILEDEPDPNRGSQLRRAANLTLASLSFIHDLRHELLEPDTVRGTPLDMYQYHRLFGMARIPTKHGCRQAFAPESRHIIVMRRGQFYWFDVLDEEHRPLLTERALLATFRAIINDADSLSPQAASRESLGVLSTEQRRTWFKARQTLEEDEHNREFLWVVDTALFVLCLDDYAPTELSDLTNNMLCGTYCLDGPVQVGTCLNRWYDKLQIIVCSNGAAGVNFEHSSVDGHTVLRFVADIYTELILQFAKSINASTKSLFSSKLSPYARGIQAKTGTALPNVSPDLVSRTSPKKLNWVWSPQVLEAVRYAEMRLSDLICQNESFVLEFKGYGKQFITRHGFSPDAFVQMAFHATHHSLYGHAVPTYEPAMTKAFRHGRTEAIRTAQPHSLAFTRKWADPEALPQEKLQSLRTACMGHAKLSKECASGFGHDRHLLALYSMWQKQHAGDSAAQPPALFADNGYQLLNHVVLSTSNCGNPSLRIFGFGPVVQDGFGIGYIIKVSARTSASQRRSRCRTMASPCASRPSTYRPDASSSRSKRICARCSA